MLRIAILGLSLLGAGCATTPDTIAPDSLGKIKTIGIVSAIGDSLAYKEIAVMVFGNDLVAKPAAEFGIDPYTIETVTKQLKGRYDVRPVKYNTADFLPGAVEVEDASGIFDSGDPIGTVIRNKVTPNDLDAYIVVLKANSGVLNTNQAVQGLGLVRRAALVTHYYWAHATYYVAIVDGHTGKVLSGAGARDDNHPFELFGGPWLAGPYKDVDETYWPEALDNVPAAQAKLLADTLKAVIANSMPLTLQSMKFLQ